jgi:chromosomal replication initiation ATPase DnaA
MDRAHKERAAWAWAQVTIVLSAVAEHFNLSVADLRGTRQTQVVVQPRRIAMYLAKQVSSASLQEIGREFGRKHHTLVLRSVVRIDEQRQVDEDLNQVITTLLEKIALPRISCQGARAGALADRQVVPADSPDCS